MRLSPGTRLGPYEILGALGAGGMGEVYRARDPKLGRDVAVKVLPEEVSADPDRRSRFEREARAASALNHPNIITIHDISEAEGVSFIVMECVQGRTLRDLLAGGPLETRKMLQIAAQAAEGLAKAHSAGIVHRDLKPENLMVSSDGVVKILDFGLAKQSSEPTPGEASTTPTLSQTEPGRVMGTLGYMSPEQAAARPVDFRSDQFSLGSILYELATGKRAFRRASAAETFSALLRDEPEPIGRLNAAAPAPFRWIVERCLRKDPEERYASTRDLARELQMLRDRLGEALDTARGPLGPGRRSARRVGFLAAGVALALLVAFGLWKVRSAGPPKNAIRLAVLPFANLTGDPEQEYFSDGLTEEMIAQLGRLHAQRVTVIARTSAMRYKKTDKPVDQIGSELGVDYILEGSARREGSRVRITAQLVQVSDQTQRWANSYERELASIMALQSDVAREIATSLALTLLPAEQARLDRVASVDPDAYEAYLKGRSHVYRLTPADLDNALLYFEQALQRDPNFALAYSGVASVWSGRRQMGFVASRDATPKEAAAVRRALELDDTLPETHAGLGTHRAFGLYDWLGGERAYRKALEINTNHADSHALYSHVLSFLGRPGEAVAHSERAVEIDPYNASHQAFYGVVLMQVRRYDEAIQQFQSALRTSPGLPFAHAQLVTTLHLKGMHSEAVAALRQAAIARGDRELEQVVARAYAEEGYEAVWRRAADTLAARPGSASMGVRRVANYYVRAGELQLGLDWLEKAYEARDPNLYGIISPEWDSVRDHPRFRDLLRRMNRPGS